MTRGMCPVTSCLPPPRQRAHLPDTMVLLPPPSSQCTSCLPPLCLTLIITLLKTLEASELAGHHRDEGSSNKRRREQEEVCSALQQLIPTLQQEGTMQHSMANRNTDATFTRAHTLRSTPHLSCGSPPYDRCFMALMLCGMILSSQG